MQKTLIHITEKKTVIGRGFILYNSNIIIFWKSKITEPVGVSVVSRDWEIGRNK